MRRAFLAAAVAMSASLLLVSWRVFIGDPISDAIERRLLDARFLARGPWLEAGGVVVVSVDESAAANYGGQAELRSALAEAATRILSAEPRAVAIDFLFAEQTPADPGLIEILAADERLLVATATLNDATGEIWSSPEMAAAFERSIAPIVLGENRGASERAVLAPTPAIASSTRFGHVNLVRTADGVARAAPLALPVSPGSMLPSLPLAAVAIAESADITLVLGERITVGRYSVPVDQSNMIIIDHLGPGGSAPTVTLSEVLNGAVSASFFRDKIVFVGATAESLGDIIATPFDQDVSGVEILASVAANLLHGRTIQRDETAIALTFAFALLLAATTTVAGRSPVITRAIAANTAVAIVGAGATHYAFVRHGLWLDGVSILSGAVVGGAVGALDRHLRMTVRARRLSAERANLAQFVAPQLADRLARDGSPGFERRTQQAAVLFVDVEGFTTFAETAQSHELGDFLSELHRYFEAVAAAHHGVVVDFQGDGAMIAFGLPEPQDDDAARALDCAIDLARRNNWRPSERFAHLRFRTSAHFGQVLAAVLGGSRQAVVTLAGDTVNLAARLQEVAKQHGLELTVTKALIDAADMKDRAILRPAVEATVRGRAQSTDTWTLCA